MLLKQAGAYGVGVVLATQDPMDIDYRVLSEDVSLTQPRWALAFLRGPIDAVGDWKDAE